MLNFEYINVKQVQNLRKTNWEIFSLILDRQRWHRHRTWTLKLLDSAAAEFEAAIQKVLHAACPPRMVNVAKASSEPVWWNNDLKKLRADTRKALTVWRRLRTEDTFEKYSQTSLQYKQEMNQSKREAWRETASQLRDTRAVSRLIRQSTGGAATGPSSLLQSQDSVTTKTPAETAQILLDCHFSDSRTCKQDGNPPPWIAVSEDCEEAEFITPSKVKWALKSFGSHKSAGPNGIKPVVLQHLSETAIAYLT